MNETTIKFPNSIEFALPAEEKASVGIIMRTRDRPILLVRAICSVINQNFTDWHLFIVNDGGDIPELDETLRPYMTKLQGKISIFNNKISLGMEAASNVAVSAILDANSGKDVLGVQEKRFFEYCIVHDDDDSWNPDFLLETVAFLEKRENARFGGVCTKTTIVEEEIRENSVWWLNEHPFWTASQDINLWEMLKTNQTPPIAFLFRSRLFLIAGEFNPALPVLGDWDFLLRIHHYTDIGFLEKPLAYYHHRKKANDVYGNSVIAGDDSHKKQRKLYEADIFRNTIRGNPSAFGLLFSIANVESRMKKETDSIHWKLDEVRREIGVVHWKLDKILEILNIKTTQKKKTFLKKIDSFFYQNFFKHLLKLFNIPKPPVGQEKKILKRLDSFFYQVFFKNIKKLFTHD